MRGECAAGVFILVMVTVVVTAGAEGHVVTAVLPVADGEREQAYWFRRLFAWAPSEGEAACARNGTVLYSATGRCHWLFDQGPCAPTHWLTLQPRPGSGLRAECVPRPCAPGFAFLADERRCAPERGLCAVGGAGSGAQSQAQQREFRYSLRGEGRCHCKGFRAQGPDGACHLLFARGPCPQGQVLSPSYDPALHSLRGACTPSVCPPDLVPLLRANASAPFCASAAGLDCSLLLAPLLEATAGLDVPLCEHAERHTVRVPSRPQGCVRDNRGVCTTYYVRSEQPFAWGLGTPEDQDDDDDHVNFQDRRYAASTAQ